MSTILDVTRIKAVFEEMREMIYNDVSDYKIVTERPLFISNFQVLKITEKHVEIELHLKQSKLLMQ